MSAQFPNAPAGLLELASETYDLAFPECLEPALQEWMKGNVQPLQQLRDQIVEKKTLLQGAVGAISSETRASLRKITVTVINEVAQRLIMASASNLPDKPPEDLPPEGRQLLSDIRASAGYALDILMQFGHRTRQIPLSESDDPEDMQDDEEE